MLRTTNAFLADSRILDLARKIGAALLLLHTRAEVNYTDRLPKRALHGALTVIPHVCPRNHHHLRRHRHHQTHCVRPG